MKVLVGLSGGVDSAIAAWKLKEQGYDVTCCFMRNWDSFANQDIAGNPQIFNDTCPQEQDYQDAMAAANKLGLKLLRKDFIKEYWDEVFTVFLKEYGAGRTPNPDILCNQFIKFDAFYKYAMEQGFDAIATGHYADNKVIDGYTYLTRSKDTNKDQTYFLAQIAQEPLSKTLFPVGPMEKPEVREIAARLELDSVARKKDSTGICFIGERDFRKFLSNYLPAKTGHIMDLDTGQILGEHEGVLYYTIGQRKGLNITHFKGPWFVVGKDIHKNILYVTRSDHRDWLISDAALVENINWLHPDPHSIPKKITAKFRYRQPDQDIEIEWVDDHSIIAHYPQGISAVTPGQEAVFYDGDICLGGGVIEKVFQRGEDLMEKIQQQAERVHG